ncbi:FACT complex subunit spt16 [Phytophthora fragariae]|uniref:FACT complex subunit n=1 Tax=Phytophthora fragariae TaxID=53985 RepID=A0A6A3WQP8_9STRA|nr:FACT complex subunit spt16 [Phytophthora fragariae]KAE8927714.1 FACT complex subunit spt16 [Phytophthora fragariae]KAE9013370.1 FACT complex subunit spt16 [Phytophthora fragariae]KAE9085306.1 FACT complex subunit spt16 [Phytophthora fragariae]KAE9111686.1 FACT complex subunit spt16 [Phytophthora fragariae]
MADDTVTVKQEVKTEVKTESSAASAPSGAPRLNAAMFFRRLNRLYSVWKERKDDAAWGGVDSFCVLAGRAQQEESGYRKSAVLQIYLLGFLEFPETLMVFTPAKLYVLTGGKKYTMLEAVAREGASSDVKLELLKRNKADGNQANFQVLTDAVKAAGPKTGVLSKENPLGELVASFKKALEAADGVQQLDVSKGLEAVLTVKESEELENIRWAGALSSKVFKLKFMEDMEQIIDDEKSISHEKISMAIEDVFDNPSKIKVTIDPVDIEPCYPPIVQSGGKYDLKPSAQSNKDPMKYDVIICSLGARYKGYCSNVGRTFFIDPTSSMEKSYELLREAHEMCVKELQPGKVVGKVVEKVRKFIQVSNPTLFGKLTKNLGFGIGLEFRESCNLLTTKNQTVIQEGMAFNVAFGFNDIPIPESQRRKKKVESYAVFLADTVVVLENETKYYTKVPKAWGKVRYDIEDDNDVEEEKSKKKSSKSKDKSVHGSVDTSLSGTRNQVLQSRLRDQQRQLEGKETDQERRDRHQAELMRRKREEAMRRLEEQNNDKSDDRKKEKSIRAYQGPQDYPSELRERQVMVDMRAEAVILPINGVPVPFHISTIKNVSKSEEDKATYLRINFFVPGTSLGRDVLPAMANAITKFPNKMFIKELGFRSTDAHNLNNQFRLIKELQKRVKQREQREQEESDLVVQEDLVLTRDRRVPRLIDLSARPHLTGRKTHGTLEAHSNGVRFTTNKNQKLDILYANIKHAIFQPCDKELVVLIHFHLKNHIMIGKKKQKDVQFYTEVIEGSQTLDNRRRSMYDPDELDEENRERALREKLNTTFKEFCHKMESVSERHGKPVVFDIPYRELGFMGTPFKEMVLLQPSVHCLVSLTDMPFFIISLDEVEHVHFERVMFSSKNFDVVFVFKNFDIMPTRISAVSMGELERIKEWLDDIDICFTTGTANLNWKSIMSTIKSDHRFYLDTDDDGVPKPAGWEFLKMEGSDDEDEDEEEAGDSNYSGASDDDDDVSESSDSDGSDWESIVDEDSSDDGASEEEDAPSWDELEKEAQASDRMRNEKRGHDDDADEEYRRSSKKKKSRRH